VQAFRRRVISTFYADSHAERWLAGEFLHPCGQILVFLAPPRASAAKIPLFPPLGGLGSGDLAVARRRPKEAVDLLTRAAELAPDSVEAHQNLSTAYKMLNKPVEAERSRHIAAELRARKERVGGVNRDRESAVAASVDERQR